MKLTARSTISCRTRSPRVAERCRSPPRSPSAHAYGASRLYARLRLNPSNGAGVMPRYYFHVASREILRDAHDWPGLMASAPASRIACASMRRRRRGLGHRVSDETAPARSVRRAPCCARFAESLGGPSQFGRGSERHRGARKVSSSRHTGRGSARKRKSNGSRLSPGDASLAPLLLRGVVGP